MVDVPTSPTFRLSPTMTDTFLTFSRARLEAEWHWLVAISIAPFAQHSLTCDLIKNDKNDKNIAKWNLDV
jgi:hypothetical protein